MIPTVALARPSTSDPSLSQLSQKGDCPGLHAENTFQTGSNQSNMQSPGTQDPPWGIWPRKTLPCPTIPKNWYILEQDMSTIYMHERNEPVAARWVIVRDKHRQRARVGCLLFLDQPWSCGQKNQEVTPTVHSSSYTGKLATIKQHKTISPCSLQADSPGVSWFFTTHSQDSSFPQFLLPITRNSQQQEQDWDSSPFSYDFNLICQCAYAKSICWLWSQNQSARFNHWTRFQGPVVKSWHGTLPRSWKLPGAPELKLCEPRARKRNGFFSAVLEYWELFN